MVLSKPLAGQKALVTGGSSGIGEAIALALGAAGADVLVNYHHGGESAARVAAQIGAGGTDAFPFGANVAKEDEVQAMFDAAIARFGRLDIVVSNSGLQKDAAIAEMSLADWQLVLDVNLTGQFLCARAAVRHFEQRGMRPDVSRALGKIICISSVHEVIPWAGHVNYAASKGGTMLLMKSLAQEVAPRRIRVNGIGPGAIKTPINRAAWETPEAEAKLLKLIPYGRVGEPADIGKAAVWLASDESDYVCGTTLFVDGGMLLYPGFGDNG